MRNDRKVSFMFIRFFMLFIASNAARGCNHSKMLFIHHDWSKGIRFHFSSKIYLSDVSFVFWEMFFVCDECSCHLGWIKKTSDLSIAYFDTKEISLFFWRELESKMQCRVSKGKKWWRIESFHFAFIIVLRCKDSMYFWGELEHNELIRRKIDKG